MSNPTTMMAVVPPVTPATNNRVLRRLLVREQAAINDASVPAAVQNDNGDEARYSDKSGTYTKGVTQASVGIVDAAAYDTFRKALDSGSPADFNAIEVGGGPRKSNGPQGGFAFNLDCLDNAQFAAPAAPAVASEDYAVEFIEMYWASLLRDVPFRPFDPKRYEDEYQNRLLELVEAKAEGKTVRATAARKPAAVVDLMQALQKSLAAAEKKPQRDVAAKAASKRAPAKRHKTAA